MNELDERLASLNAERARPMARWGVEAPSQVLTPEQVVEYRRFVARDIASHHGGPAGRRRKASA